MRVLITGAGGLVGRALSDASGDDNDVTALLHRDLDITDEAAVSAVVHRVLPQLVINCAVIGVDDCEWHPERAASINVAGPSLLATAAERVGAGMVHFSSNYVFAGDRNDRGFYLPKDEAVPINVYGSTKLAGERAVTAACARSWIIRTSWVFGRGKESFLATLPAMLRAGKPVSAMTDIFASATYVEDLVARLREIIDAGMHGTYHVNNDGVCSYAEFAEEVADALGLAPRERSELIERTSESQLKKPAARPRWTPMRCDRSAAIGLPPLRSWQEAVRAYVNSGP